MEPEEEFFVAGIGVEPLLADLGLVLRQGVAARCGPIEADAVGIGAVIVYRVPVGAGRII